MKAYKIYLDVCCLNRPLDDAQQERIRLEAEAVLLIYRRIRIGECQLISSEVIDIEIAQTRNPQRRKQLQIAVALAYNRVKLSDDVKKRAVQVSQMGFKPFDAAHIASAELGNADIFLTTDDRLLKKAAQYRKQLAIDVKNPASWLIEIN